MTRTSESGDLGFRSRTLSVCPDRGRRKLAILDALSENRWNAADVSYVSFLYQSKVICMDMETISMSGSIDNQSPESA